ncbi:AAA family ATPase [Caballeronia sp. INML1]|uniref:AAA family ATPase n=2 Tax=Caballeronia TaxID=1827195 RepID=UPI0020291097|nr:AAA family ATPase [Caballeronia sp. INML1]
MPRTKLLTQLQRMQHATLALVTGSAGYGKTTLLAQWRQACVEGGGEVAWITLTADEKQYADFCAALVAALQRIGLCADADLRIDDANPRAMEAVIATIVESTLDLQKDLFVFIDDYHYVESPLAHRFIQKLIDHAPGNLHVAIASRVAPTLSLSRLRMMNQLVELDSAELPFSLAETRAFIEGNLGTGKLDADALKLIHELTSGCLRRPQLLCASYLLLFLGLRRHGELVTLHHMSDFQAHAPSFFGGPPTARFLHFGRFASLARPLEDEGDVPARRSYPSRLAPAA